MATEYKLSYTASTINEKLGKIDSLAEKSEIPTKTSELTNDSGFLTSIPNEYVTETELDDKGYLTEHQDLSLYALKTDIPSVPVTSVNNQTGDITLNAFDVGALPNTTKIPTSTSELTNDSGYITSYTETDPTVPSWAKASAKPTYTKSEVGLGNVDNVKQYSASNPPPYPVTKVNNKTGAVTLTASDVGADASGTASSAISAHNSDVTAHADIREEISQISSEKANKSDVEDLQEQIDILTGEALPYTNMLPLALAADGTNIYNEKGYKENTRYSGSSQAEVATTGIYLSGFIPIKAGDVIRIKNITMPFVSGGNNTCVVFFYDELSIVSGSANCELLTTYNSAIFDANNNLTQFAIQSIDRDTKYIRIQASQMSSESILTINEEIPEDTIEVQIDEINENLNSINERLDAIEENNTEKIDIPEYWQNHLPAKVDYIHNVMEVAGRNKSSFIFYSDAHWDNGSLISPKLINYLAKNTAINKTIFGGDIVNTEPTTETLSDRSIMKYLWDWRSQIRDLKHYSVVGNHDDGNATNNIFDTNYVYSFLFAPEENNDIVRGGDTYYYFDDKSEKTRYLCLDTAYLDAGSLSTVQSDFIKEALKTTPENWHIIVVAHIWYMPDYDAYYNQGVRPIPMTGLSTAASSIVTILDNYNTRADVFTDCKAKVDFCIGGHVHRDYVDKTTGNIPIIVCETASLGYRGEFTASTGNTTETAISGVITDYNKKIVTVVRVGRGNSFTVDLTTATMTEITEDTSVEPDEPSEPTYTNLLEEVGWTEGIRLGGSDGTDRTAEGKYTTGFIPAKSGDIIYLKNVNMPNSNNDYSCCGYHFKADKSYINGFHYSTAAGTPTIEYDSNGWCTKFKVSESAALQEMAYLRISCNGIDDTSIITVNEPIE